MNRIKKIIRYIFSIPKNIFSKCSIFSFILESEVSKKSAILHGCRFYNSTLDDYSYIGRNSIIVNCKIGKFTSIANNCNIGLANHNLSWLSTSPVFSTTKNCLKKNFNIIENTDYKETIIGNDVWIGANCLIKSGVKIGDGAIIGAGSVVTKDVEAYTIVGGNPAKFIRNRFSKEQIDIIQNSKWWNFTDDKLKSLNCDFDLVISQLSNKNVPKILIQSIYAAPYRVGVFEEIQKDYDTIVFFEHQQGHNRNKKFFKNENKLKCYFLDKKDDRKIYKNVIKNLKQYDVVFVYDYSSISSIKLMLKCLKNNVPYFINCDGYMEPNKKSYLSFVKTSIKKYFISRATKCLANGQVSKKYFLSYNAKEENIVLHKFSSLYKNEIDNDIISDKKEIKRELGLDPGKRVFLSVGSFCYGKGYDILFKAIKKINNNNIQYVIIGGGELLDQYLQYCKSEKITNVKIIDFMSKEKIMKYYEAADVFVFPTRYDIWGLVINEAMSKGLPIISTDKCAAAMEMVTKDNGIVVKSDSVGSLKEAIDIFIEKSDDDLKNMGLKSLKIAKEYNIEAIAESHKNVIKQVIER